MVGFERAVLSMCATEGMDLHVLATHFLYRTRYNCNGTLVDRLSCSWCPMLHTLDLLSKCRVIGYIKTDDVQRIS